MAVDNLFLGTARKSVGDITFYTRNGKQVSRKRIRKVYNPKTLSQATRRCTFAPAARFYSPLSAVLEQSWEGLSKSESYTAFLKQAVRDCAANGWYVGKDMGFFPMPFQVSKGTIRPVNYTFIDTVTGLVLDGTGDSEEWGSFSGDTIGDLSQLFIKLGYEAGQQVTLIVVKWHEGTGAYPEFWRFIIAPESTVPSPITTVSLMFESDMGLYFHSLDVQGDPMIAGAIIVSNYSNGKWRRSTQRVEVSEETMATITSEEAYENATASYMQTESNVQSDVYLNGSTGGGTVQSSIWALDDGAAFTPRSIGYDNGVAWVSGVKGTSAVTWCYVKIGNDILLTASTKGQPGAGATLPARWVDGTDPVVKNWLQSQGVAASVF